VVRHFVLDIPMMCLVVSCIDREVSYSEDSLIVVDCFVHIYQINAFKTTDHKLTANLLMLPPHAVRHFCIHF